MIELIKKLPEDSLEPMDWQCAGETVYNLGTCLVFCLVFIILAELGFFKQMSKPILKPIWMYTVHAFKFLRKKKPVKMYDIRKDFDIEEIGESSEEDTI